MEFSVNKNERNRGYIYHIGLIVKAIIQITVLMANQKGNLRKRVLV